MTKSTKEKIEKDTTIAEELDITSSSKREKVLDWLWDGPTKRTVLGYLKGRREKKRKDRHE